MVQSNVISYSPVSFIPLLLTTWYHNSLLSKAAEHCFCLAACGPFIIYLLDTNSSITLSTYHCLVAVVIVV